MQMTRRRVVTKMVENAPSLHVQDMVADIERMWDDEVRLGPARM
jgi:hypothetical protein